MKFSLNICLYRMFAFNEMKNSVFYNYKEITKFQYYLKIFTSLMNKKEEIFNKFNFTNV